MKETLNNISDLSLAAKADIKEIILSTVPGIVEGIVEGIVDSKIEKFAAMVKRGFDETATKEDLNEFKQEMYVFRDKTETSLYNLSSDMIYVKDRLNIMDARIDNIEDILRPTVNQVNDHEERIGSLEGVMA